MENRKEINDRLVEWIINKVKKEYAEDVSLVLIYGSYINGTANSKSDVDCYYIPKTERGYQLAATFMIDGVGYDIFPISWERVEEISNLKENLLPLVGDAKIIYSNSAADVEHFQAMQAKQKKNLLNDEHVRKIAMERCEGAGKICALLNRNRSISEVRKMAGNMIMTLADAIAIYNHDYFHFGLKNQFENLQNNFKKVPQDIVIGYRNVVEANDIDEIIKCAAKLFEDICQYLDVSVPLQEAVEKEDFITDEFNVSWLVGLYEEISSTFNKIYVCCENGDYILAFLSAVCLQRDLDDAKEAGCPAYELLSSFNYKELSELSETAQKIESDLVRLITENGGFIKQYDSFDDFKAANL